MKNLLLLVLIVYSVQINAQQKTDSVLAHVTVTGLSYEAKSVMPISYSSVNKSRIQSLDYTAEPSSILQTLPGISYSTDNGTLFGYSYFRLRGLDQSRINISLNGLPLNEPEDAGVYFSNLPGILSNSSSLQLQRGLGLSKNGSPAFAGSLDFETFAQQTNYTTIGIGAGSFNSANIYAEHANEKGNDQFYYKLLGIKTDGYKYHSDNTSGTAMFQWQHKMKSYQLQYILLGGTNKNGLGWLGVSDSAIKADPRSNGNSALEKGNFSQIIQQLHLTKTINPNSSIHAGIFYNYTDGEYGFDLYNFLGFGSNGQYINYKTKSSYGGALIDYNYRSTHFSFTTGMYGSFYRKYHDGINEPTGNTAYNNYGNKNEFSPFAKLIYHVKQFYFFTDLQYRTAAFSYHGDASLPTFKWNFVNPLAGIGYQLDKHWYFYISSGNIQREPGRNDIFEGNDNLQKDANGNAVYANLAAENNFSTDAGLRYQNDKLSFSLSAYRMQIEHAIDLNGQIGPTGVPLHSNVAEALRKGIETEIHYQFAKQFLLSESFAWASHHIIQDGINSSPVLTPTVISFTELQYQKNNFTIIAQAKYQAKSYIDFANNYSMPAYTLFNLLVKYDYRKFFFTAKWMNISNQTIYANGQLNVWGKPIYQVNAASNLFAGIGIKF
ncbi:MAG: TonB-dependent receptor [Bacteroidota bacterium]|nr:TonB-dependent receptor [Bacteroidota bacterium]